MHQAKAPWVCADCANAQMLMIKDWVLPRSGVCGECTRNMLVVHVTDLEPIARTQAPPQTTAGRSRKVR